MPDREVHDRAHDATLQEMQDEPDRRRAVLAEAELGSNRGPTD